MSHCKPAYQRQQNRAAGLGVRLALILAPLALCTTTAQQFLRVEEQAKIDHVQNSNGVAVADYDQDGDLDIFMVGVASFDPADETTWNRLLKNNGDATFEDVTLESGFDDQFVNQGPAAPLGEKAGAAWGDYDNDGFPDLFLTNSRLDELYHNEGDGTFTNVTEAAGVAGCSGCISTSGLWWDYDRDGDLDLYVSVWNQKNRMYENVGDGTFEDITESMLLGDGGATWASVPIDADRDGWPDLYVVNDFGENKFYLNQEGQRFIDVSKAYGLDDIGDGMGVTIGDYNNDGFFDIYVTNLWARFPNPLFTSTANQGFTDMAHEMGVTNAGWGWGTHFLDYDHDGDEDLYAVNGVEDGYVVSPVEQFDINNFLFKNTLMEEGVGFLDVSAETGTGDTAKSKGLEVFDYDGDGDLDLLVSNMEGSPFLYRNEIIMGSQPESANWIQIWLEGTESNRDAVGSEVKISINGNSYYRWHHGAGFLCQSIKPVHFGLGSAQVIDEMQVTWPLGLVETFKDVQVNQIIRIREGDSAIITGVEDEIAVRDFMVYNYPNPFSGSTTFRLELAKPGTVDLRIFSIAGMEVFRLSEANHHPGVVEINWGGTDKSCINMAPGAYFYTVDFEGNRIGGKMMKVE